MLPYKTSSLIEYEEKRKRLEAELERKKQLFYTSTMDERNLRQLQFVNASNELKDIIAKSGDYENRLIKILEQRDLPREVDDRRVDIFIITYNQPELEQECITRILKYTDHYYLHIYRNRKGFINTSKIWNHFIKSSTCKYILIMDSDAFVTEDGWLDKMLSVFEQNANVSVVVPIAGERSNVTTFQCRKPSKEKPFIIDYHFSGYFFLFSREAYNYYGGFDEEFNAFGQDSDWCERMLEDTKYEIYCHPGVLVEHGREHGGSESLLKAEREEKFDWEIDAELSKYLFEYKKEERRKKQL